MTGTKQQLHQNRILSVFLPPSLPQIRWSREIYLAKLSPQKLGKGIQKRRKILFEKHHRRSLCSCYPLERQFRFEVRAEGVKVVALGRRRWKITTRSRSFAKSFSPLSLSLAHFHFSFPPVSWSNYLVSLVGISVLRHWSAGSGPAGRLFCKSNRSTRRALSGGPLSLSLTLSPSSSPLRISLSFSRPFPFFTLFFPVPCNVAAPPARPPFYF